VHKPEQDLKAPLTFRAVKEKSLELSCAIFIPNAKEGKSKKAKGKGKKKRKAKAWMKDSIPFIHAFAFYLFTFALLSVSAPSLTYQCRN
jgi:hypothetical protein